ncbi:ESX secretion-associated protein EspG [Saccharopolyspora rhizosphaerae]|uniref:ESX secretion-associated protein EspG n=1 Tax=Saccharopolyspora rhizosphaerae TaxID=2492662 RepID=A0A426JI04_9PSEU|nr:ESX secretion-associated protein EspG [Saccharopolyspora rhizosphaerae]RRO12776.1 ESX secretion-associated protein EspG [Saccharopolyspora rhizosphaerae]
MNTSTSTDRRISLSALEFDVLVEHLRIDHVPLVLKVPSPGRTHSERAELVASAWRRLSRRGLVSGGELDEGLDRALHLITDPAREVDGRCWAQRSVRVLAAAEKGGEHAVLAVKDEDVLTFSPASASGLPRAAVSPLPDVPAGPGRSVSVPSDALDAAAEEVGEAVERLPAALQRRGVRSDDAEALAEMVAGAATRGQFGVAARDRHGRRTRAERVIGFFDTALGRYVQSRTTSASGQAWSTIAPVNDRRLIGRLDELLAEVADR